MTSGQSRCDDPDPSPVTPDTTLATIALRNDAYAAVLDRHQLDFCCRGRRTLSEACATQGLDVRSVLDELDVEVRGREIHGQSGVGAAASDWVQRPVGELVDFIVGTHHAFTRAAIARIRPLLLKVVAKHGAGHPELGAVASAFGELAADMEPHMLREERVLFPYIRALDAPGGVPAAPPFGTVRNPVRMMMREHDRAAELLAEIERATHRFDAPADACASFKAVYAALAELRIDLLRHVSLENNVLFPRAIALEVREPCVAPPA